MSANIFIYDEFNPEDTAMMQALYSRSPLSVTEHVEKVKNAGSGKFMEKFYVQYGHKSIADCGSTTIFIEGISMLGDKAIQDWPLYSGQETSTRYINMSKQPIVDPINTKESKDILKKWMNFYVNNQENVKEYLRKKHPKKKDQEESVYEKTITARTFDIMRGFLPAGITTQLSWHTNLRQAKDKLSLLRHHPLKEVKRVAENIYSNLQEKYPNSFSHKKYEDQEEYHNYIGKNYTYYIKKEVESDFSYSSNIDAQELNKYKDLIQKRPEKTNLPHFLTELGNIVFDFTLDFGSFRDIQRHRNGTCRMPLLTTELDFNSWYLEQLPEETRKKANILIEEQTKKIKNLDTNNNYKQYYTAMGFNVACRASYGLPATIYVIELRAGKAVHPTLRKVAHKMDKALQTLFPEITLHSDLEPSSWDIKRGSQDIIEK
ncbi:FAD-dependent thymidylate synthase [bacterium]|nr:FAD-dependent thymidylate synthase [bacterium]